MSDNNEGTAFVAGFIIGGLVGAAVALVLAPQSGEETRAQIRERGIELKTRAEDVGQQVRERTDAVVADARKRAEEIIAGVIKEVLYAEAQDGKATLKVVDGVPVMHLYGSGAEMGKQYGTLLKRLLVLLGGAGVK